MKINKKIKIRFAESYYIPLPKMVGEMLELKKGDELSLEIQGNKIIFTVDKNKK